MVLEDISFMAPVLGRVPQPGVVTEKAPPTFCHIPMLRDNCNAGTCLDSQLTEGCC